jgi:hypothetical protein
MLEDELQRALAGSIGQQRAGEIAREITPILAKHPLLGVLGSTGVVSASAPAIIFLAESSPKASGKDIAKDYLETQKAATGGSKKPKKKQWQFWKK